MIKDIEKNIELINKALKWADNYQKDIFPRQDLKKYRRELRNIRFAFEENCSIAAYGQSQVGKSYLMSSLLSTADAPFVITNQGKEYSFINDINGSGAKMSEMESTGIITRFTNRKVSSQPDKIRVRTLSIVDIILMLTDSYYSDVKGENMQSETINNQLAQLSSIWTNNSTRQEYITEDDIYDIGDYIKNNLVQRANAIHNSYFIREISEHIAYIPVDRWSDVFSLLWNGNAELSRLFIALINAYQQIHFHSEVYLPFNSVLREKGTLLDIRWLDHIFDGEAIDNIVNVEKVTSVYDSKGVLLCDIHKSFMSALMAEITLTLPDSLVEDRAFLKKMDLLDFPGARARGSFKESEIEKALPEMLRRGKVSYLFNKYSQAMRISSVLFCHHQNQKSESSVTDSIDTWISKNIGETPAKRASMLNRTNGIAPIFFVATKFNADLKKVDTDAPGKSLAEHWGRFDTVIPELIGTKQWFKDFVTIGGQFRTSAFQNIYPLRSFSWSKDQWLFDGYSENEPKSPERSLHIDPSFPNYFDELKKSFLEHSFVKTHFSNPEQTWNDVATVNNDGSKRIIEKLDAISQVLDQARFERYHEHLISIKETIIKQLSLHHISEDIEQQNNKVRTIIGDTRMSVLTNVGAKPEVFGNIIDQLMIPTHLLRDAAYDIFVRHTIVPRDFGPIQLMRTNLQIDLSLGREANIERMLYFFMCDDESMLREKLSSQGISLDDLLTDSDEITSTESGVVTEQIVKIWYDYISQQVQPLSRLIAHPDEVVFMLQSLFERLNVKRTLFDRIKQYEKTFNKQILHVAVADVASLLLNNFVSTVGIDYMDSKTRESILEKAQIIHIKIDVPMDVHSNNTPSSIASALDVFEQATDLNRTPIEILTQLPFWANFKKWCSLVEMGFVCTSDVVKCDPRCNNEIKQIIDGCTPLYI